MITQLLIDILKPAFAGLLIFAAFAYWAKPHISRYFRIRQLEIKTAQSEQTLSLRLQAYERLVLFVDRINPKNLILRLHDPELSAREFQAILINEVRNEFQHNSTQQLYVSPTAWETVSTLKEDTLTLINNTAAGFGGDERASGMGKAVLNHLAALESDPYRAAALLLRSDLGDLF